MQQSACIAEISTTVTTVTLLFIRYIGRLQPRSG